MPEQPSKPLGFPNVFAYVQDSGAVPFEKWLKKEADKRQRAKAFALFERYSNKTTTQQTFKHLRESVYEFRLDRQTRVLAFLDGADVVVSHGFWKETDDVPDEDIEKVKERRRDYFQRKGSL